MKIHEWAANLPWRQWAGRRSNRYCLFVLVNSCSRSSDVQNRNLFICSTRLMAGRLEVWLVVVVIVHGVVFPLVILMMVNKHSSRHRGRLWNKLRQAESVGDLFREVELWLKLEAVWRVWALNNTELRSKRRVLALLTYAWVWVPVLTKDNPSV